MTRKLTADQRTIIRDCVMIFLKKSMGEDYCQRIREKIIEYVYDDVEECADDNWNYDDVKLAIGRAFCHYLKIEF